MGKLCRNAELLVARKGHLGVFWGFVQNEVISAGCRYFQVLGAAGKPQGLSTGKYPVAYHTLLSSLWDVFYSSRAGHMLTSPTAGTCKLNSNKRAKMCHLITHLSGLQEHCHPSPNQWEQAYVANWTLLSLVDRSLSYSLYPPDWRKPIKNNNLVET